MLYRKGEIRKYDGIGSVKRASPLANKTIKTPFFIFSETLPESIFMNEPY